VAIVIWMHVARPDIAPAQRGISRYAERKTLIATTMAFLALALALGAVAWRLHSGLFTAACLSMAAIAATPKPGESRTITGAIHTVAGFVFFVTAAAAAKSWSPHGARAAVADLLWTVTALFIASILGARVLSDTAGLYQRACFALLILWLMLPA